MGYGIVQVTRTPDGIASVLLAVLRQQQQNLTRSASQPVLCGLIRTTYQERMAGLNHTSCELQPVRTIGWKGVDHFHTKLRHAQQIVSFTTYL